MKALLFLLFSISLFLFTFSSDVTTLSSKIQYRKTKIDAVMLTAGKDTLVFEKSIKSALIHLLDVDKFYVITPASSDLTNKFSSILGERVVFVDEKSFPFNGSSVADVMIESVKHKGVYPLDNGKSPFERALWARIGWFLQQLLKIYAGKVLHLQDYVLLDSDIVWFKDVKFIQDNTVVPRTYLYSTSNQYHPAYIASMVRIGGVNLLPNQKYHRSGICHHMVIAEYILEDLFNQAQNLHHNLPFWQILLNQSAIEMTCRAPRGGICGSGSTLSEYELYFNYARNKFPSSVELRPLLWANGPSPGMMYVPSSGVLESDGPKRNWRSFRIAEIPENFGKQIVADQAQGYDFIAYHSYAKRRYFELLDPDIEVLCGNQSMAIINSTCSYEGLNLKEHSLDKWFSGCACYMANHQSGP